MNREKFLIVFWAVVRAILFFAVVMGVSMGFVMLNADQSPDVIWFPVPVIGVLAGAIIWAQRRWDIGLAHPAGMPWGRVYAVGAAVTVLGLTVCILQGAYYGFVRETEIIADNVSSIFAMTYAFVMSVVAAILAEATFRGVLQTRIQAALGVWPTVIVVGIINTLAHRWGPELAQNWLGLFVIMSGWTYLRWLSQSLVPPVVLHGLVNLLLAAALWAYGPLDHAVLGIGALTTVALVGLASLAVAIILSRGIDRPRSAISYA